MSNEYFITAYLTFSTTAIRDNVLSKINEALLTENWAKKVTTYPAGVNADGALSLTVSIEVPGRDPVAAMTLYNKLYNAIQTTNKPTSGWVGMNSI